ncbi:retrovirus-related pol polyprotein from transposon tnt 1-94 [Lasius niger]|uniref:Retrovirus-related pol polyprotein from transposon tnt 1-94 n=2 Tax=Lasius TaxID=488720 RepID=A0A0J7KBT4_LASNI|nr:retrovirus-related pol polyprotein from transposon tnt 1-94 [Lasius niger]
MAAKEIRDTNACQHTWHRRFGHRHHEDMEILQSKNLVQDLKMKDCRVRKACECCIMGKMPRKPFPKQSGSRSTEILELVHTDLCGPMQTPTASGKIYFMTMIDDHSRYTETYFLQSKSETVSQIKNYVEKMKTKFGKKPKIIRSDNGREFANKVLCDYFDQEGIQVQYSTPYSPQQNGVAERKNRALGEAARCMLIDANMANKFWAEAINTATYLQNILPTKIHDKTSYELWNDKRASVKHLRIFECKGYVHIPKANRRKLDPTATLLTFVGYSTESKKAYRILDQKTNRIIINRDLTFVEDDMVNEFASKLKSKRKKEIQVKKNLTKYNESENSNFAQIGLEADSDKEGGDWNSEHGASEQVMEEPAAQEKEMMVPQLTINLDTTEGESQLEDTTFAESDESYRYPGNEDFPYEAE